MSDGAECYGESTAGQGVRVLGDPLVLGDGQGASEECPEGSEERALQTPRRDGWAQPRGWQGLPVSGGKPQLDWQVLGPERRSVLWMGVSEDEVGEEACVGGGIMTPPYLWPTH